MKEIGGVEKRERQRGDRVSEGTETETETETEKHARTRGAQIPLAVRVQRF